MRFSNRGGGGAKRGSEIIQGGIVDRTKKRRHYCG